ncbi:unnamed protein product [Arabis nemorensis]|uniref:Uncharacterized protein n=1 Tax=Arabis nemorensis TaxID=586526 RepID=A0A565C1A1_9BRAS|nr:unnamed protein product [Arabis nemorensis]
MFFSLFRRCCSSTAVVSDHPSSKPELEPESEPVPTLVPYSDDDGTRWRPSLSTIIEEEERGLETESESNKKKSLFHQILKRFWNIGVADREQ